jgi:cupin fold WbuC family metalloprotein
MIRLIDGAMLDELTAAAKGSARLRKNHNFHPGDDYPAHRLLNAAEPDTYIAPHRHLEPGKDESLVILRGRMGVVLFNEDGSMAGSGLLSVGGDCYGVDIPHGTWHTFVALETGTVIFEAKAGPYRPLSAAERAPWAPAENDAKAGEYLAWLRTILS